MTTEQNKQTITLDDFDAAARSLKVSTQGLLFILAEIMRAQEARIRQLEQAPEMEVDDG